MKIIDLSLEIDNECMTCGTAWHEKVCIEQLGEMEKVGRNTTAIRLGSHTGTHIDAPKHFSNQGYGVDKLDLNILCGNITVVDFTHIGKGEMVVLSDVEKLEVTERMLFRFNWHKWWKTEGYYREFPFFSLEAAKYLIDSGMKLIALDTPSPDDGKNISSRGEEDSPVHKHFLSKDVIIIEYLTNTDALDLDKKYCLAALPLKLKDVDGAPARVVVMEE